MFVKLPSGRGEHDQMENRERSTNRSRSGVVGQGSLDHHVGRGGKFPILTNGSGISIAPMIDRSAACAAAGCSVEQEGCESILQARKLYNVKADVVGQLLCNCKTAKLPPTLISPACFSREALERK
ncbi:hypothetical protein D917_05715 [Trichinella nativa]|uniref:Uncharacterized protein n=1 Tax=Trichinella nativa TaxID=6335 RepID=A0A1Y3F1A5_9BILA|nr:hypothetical protein D917_05715 [Trichinella nativa]